MSEVQNRKELILKFLKERNKLVFLVLILLLGLILRFNYSILKAPVAEWWDSADYMSTAKAMVFPEFREHVTQFGINARRPFFLALLWAPILFFNGSDTALHYPILILSLLTVYFTYLLGKKLYNENTGLLAALLLAVSWVHLFFSARLLTDVPSLAFWMMSGYFFWRGYIEEEGNKYLWYAAAFFGLSIFTRAASVMNILPILVLLVLKERHKFILNKKIWISLIIFFLVLSPFIIWLFATFDNPIQKFTGIGGGETRFRAAQGGFKFSDLADLWKNLNFVATSLLGPSIMSNLGTLMSPNFIGFILMLVTIILCSDAILGIDVLWKERNKELMKKIYLLVWILTPYLFYSIINPGVEDRYLFAMFPIMFIIFSDGLLKIAEKLKKYWKYLGIIFLVLIYGIFVYYNINDASATHESKRLSYAEIAQSGKWIKEHSDLKDRIISASKYQAMYYSERDTFPFCDNQECKENETIFIEKRLKEIDPKFVVVSVYEPGFTPQWAYTVAQRYPSVLEPVQAFSPPGQQSPYLIVYEYKQHQSD